MFVSLRVLYTSAARKPRNQHKMDCLECSAIREPGEAATRRPAEIAYAWDGLGKASVIIDM